MMRNCAFFVVAFCSTPVFAESTDRATPAGRSPPNILFILADDLGWNAPSCYGNRHIETPHIDRLAAKGMRFTTAYADSQCSPSRGAFLSGQYGGRTGLFKVIHEKEPPHAYMRPPDAVLNMSPQVACLPHCLRGAGYATAISGKWHIADGGSVAGLRLREQGRYFDTYGFDFAGTATPGGYEDADKAVDAITNELGEFIRTNRDRHWFAYAAHFTTHTPLIGPPDLVEKHVARGYRRSSSPGALTSERPTADYLAMLEHLDNGVGKLLNVLDELDLADNTLVIFFSDNGGLGRMASMSPLRESKGSPYEGGIRVPFIARWPRQIAAGSSCHVPIHIVDFLPTFLEIAGCQPPASHPLDGESLLPLLTQKGGLRREALFWHMPTYTVMYGRTPCSVIRKGDWKLIHWFGDWLDTRESAAELYTAYGRLRVGSRTELYHLKNDPSESQDLSDVHPNVLAELRSQLSAWWKDVGAPLPTRNRDYISDKWAHPAKQ